MPGDIETLRVRHQVRLVAPEEEGRTMDALPDGVYGFSYAPGQGQVPLFARKGYHSFEFHKAADGSRYVVGFVTPQEAADIESGQGGAAVTLFPDPWEKSGQLVSLRLERIVAPMKVLPRLDGNPFPFTLA